MTPDDQGSTHPSLEALPELLGLLSPLESIGNRNDLVRSLARSIVTTVASGCVFHVLEDGHLAPLVRSTSVPPPDDAVIERVVASATPAVLDDDSGERVWMIFPLIAGNASLGAMSLHVERPREGSGPHHRRDLERVASIVARAMSEADSHQRAAQISHALQVSLLPGALPEGDWFELAARYIAGTADLRIGGDWYDSQVMPDGTVALSVGDVAGHGVEAAALMGELRSAMIALRLVRSAPDELLSVVHLLAEDVAYFATVICARLDPTGNLRWASAGHLPPLVIHADGTPELLETDQSPPLGVGHRGRVPLNRYRLDAGDTVVIYTDGLVERRDQTIEESLELLASRAAGRRSDSVVDLIDQLVAESHHPLSTGDDIAVLAARWQEARPPAGTPLRPVGDPVRSGHDRLGV